MTDDAGARLAEQVLVDMAIDVRVQLEKGTGTRPLLWLLTQSRKRAVIALDALTQIDPVKVDDIRHLQNEVTLYRDMIDALQRLMAETADAVYEIDERDRSEIEDLLTPEQALEMGLQPRAED